MGNSNIQVSSFKSSINIPKKKGGTDCTVSNNSCSLVTLNELGMKAGGVVFFHSITTMHLSLSDETLNRVPSPYDLSCW